LGQSTDQWLEEGSVLGFIVLEFIHNFFISSLDLSEGNTVHHVLDQFGGFIDSSDGISKFSINTDPFSVFSFSFVSVGFDGSNSFVIISDSLSELAL